jgi:hypothetical protein
MKARDGHLDAGGIAVQPEGVASSDPIPGMHDPGDMFLRLEPYLPDFAEAALMEGEDTALLAALCLRETHAGWAPGYVPKGCFTGRGDHGHGFGLFQIDDRGPYRHLPAECPEATPMLQARWACAVLEDARRELAAFRGHPLFERATLAAYNAGSPRVATALRAGLDPDSVTTGKNYGADVLHRRDRLRSRYPHAFPSVSG